MKREDWWFSDYISTFRGSDNPEVELILEGSGIFLRKNMIFNENLFQGGER